MRSLTLSTHRFRSTRAALCLALALVLGSLPAAAAPAAPAAGGTAAAPVDLNGANEQELMAIPGIGEAMAKRIVEFRKANGPFRQVDDLLKVKGIGEKSLEKLRPHVSVGKAAK